MPEFTLKKTNLIIRKENILAALGMKVSEADDYLLGLIREFTAQCSEICEPRAAYTIIDNPEIDQHEGKLTLDHTEFQVGRQVASYLKNCGQIAVFVCTAGEKTEKLSKKFLTEKHPLEGLIVDLIGSEIAEGIADYAQNIIKEYASASGLRITNRYSPGYCNWPVSDQQNLFSVLRGNNCGIKLTPSSLMIPVKSVSGMIGTGKNVKHAVYKCKLCSDENCILRNRITD